MALIGESRFHRSTPLGIEPRSLMTGSRWVDHWTSGTAYECSKITLFRMANYCIARNRKKGFIYPHSQNNCIKISGLIRNLVTRGEVWLGGVRPGLAHQMYDVDHLYPLPPPHTWVDRLMNGENDIYWVLRNSSFAHSVAVTQYCDTSSHCIIIIFIISKFISLLLLTPRKSKLNILGCHYASFPTRSLGFLELFSNSPLSDSGLLSQGPASRTGEQLRN